MDRPRVNSAIGRRHVRIRRFAVAFASTQVAKKTCAALGWRIGEVDNSEQVKRDRLEES